jgi:hypothetical protein
VEEGRVIRSYERSNNKRGLGRREEAELFPPFRTLTKEAWKNLIRNLEKEKALTNEAKS